jgi:hypothetical protein
MFKHASNIYNITTNQAAMIALFRVVNQCLDCVIVRINLGEPLQFFLIGAP